MRAFFSCTTTGASCREGLLPAEGDAEKKSTVPKLTQSKIGLVLLKEVAPRRWRASWMDPLKNTYMRRVLPATTYREAESQAREINAVLAQGKGFGGRLRGSVGHSIADAVIEAVKHSDANERTRKDYLRRANPFMQYLIENAKGIHAWEDVTEAIIQNYLEYCRRQHLAYDSIRQRLFVLRLTSNYMARTYGDRYRNITSGIKLRRADPTKAELEEKDAILRPNQMREFLNWLKDQEPMVYCWAMLQGLCGLRLLEAGYLREQDFDREKRTIQITESTAHKPKNRHSYRDIPVCEAVAATLESWISNLQVRHPEGYLFEPKRPNMRAAFAKSREARAGAYGIDFFSQTWVKVLRKARRDGVDLPRKFVARRLRASFITAMREAGIDVAVLQRYVGHSPSSILSAHYDFIGLDRLGTIAQLAEDLFHAQGTFVKPSAKDALGRIYKRG